MTTVMIVGAICGTWIVFSAFIATIICINSSRLTRLEERQRELEKLLDDEYERLFGVGNYGEDDD